MSAVKELFASGWSHGKYVDYWSFVHFLTGAILGIGSIILTLPHFFSFVLILVLLIAYEGIEMLGRVSEGIENILSDIVIGGAGSALTIFYLPQILSTPNLLGLLSLCIFINLICVSEGWKNYLKRKASSGDFYTYILWTLYFIYVLGSVLALTSLVYFIAGFF
ncbi:MAG: hypothetical protein KBC06_02920 [Candidatus Pacebacteria bacterium]|nr:hypothetical protein [Candidatus Paceibacterota bacterium]